jgi:hypothetical protein
MKKSSGWILNANTPYTVWAAPKIKGVQFGPSAWRPFGPFTFSGRQRMIFNWDGASHGGRMANNIEITGTTTILSPALASLHVQNFDGNNVWIIVNPLPPGCGPNTGGNSESDIPPTATTTARANGGVSGKPDVSKVPQRFPATAAVTKRGSSPFDGLWHTHRVHTDGCSYIADDDLTFSTDANGITTIAEAVLAGGRGQVTGNTYTFSYGPGNTGSFTLSKDGRSFSGFFSDSNKHRGTFQGRR